jgi:hypothetical protein
MGFIIPIIIAATKTAVVTAPLSVPAATVGTIAGLGDEYNSGIGVLNDSAYRINCGLSMGGTHYYENTILPGEIFYRYPGNVWYTTYCFPDHEDGRITDGKAAAEIATIVAAGIAAAVAIAYTISTAGSDGGMMAAGIIKVLSWKSAATAAAFKTAVTGTGYAKLLAAGSAGF